MGGALAALAAVGFAAAASGAGYVNTPADICDIRIKGPIGDRIESCIRHHVMETDVRYITDCFYDRTEARNWWQTEFWGKYMHSAMPFAVYTGCPLLRKNVDEGLVRVVEAQTKEGYIGNYPPDRRCGEGWDVWGMKYTLLGLLHYYDGARVTGDGELGTRALKSAMRLCDFVISELGPGGKRPFWTTGNFAGMPSCTILEPVVWLYDRVRVREDLGGQAAARKYLDFATHLVSQMSEVEHGPRLIDLALSDVPVYKRWPLNDNEKNMPGHVSKKNRLKAYEMMSCYQGLLEYYEATGRKDCLEAAVKTAMSIARDEVNVVGGSASDEHWFHGAVKQHLPYRHLQETCVTTTWMRLCEKLLALTGDRMWADELEKTFYNAYLAAMRKDGGAFAAYTPLNGSRLFGHDHCRMHTDCCNANGPRGFIAFMRAFMQASEKTAIVNFYASGRAGVQVPGLEEKVVFDQYTHYPKSGTVLMWNRTKKTQDFTLKLRIPAWGAGTTVKINADAPIKAKPGEYLALSRTWREGDRVEIRFDMAVRVHRLDHAVAFTRGPVALARDTRSGDRGEVLRAPVPDKPQFTLVRVEDPDVLMACSAILPFGSHSENVDGVNPAAVTFVDYASAGNDWRPDNIVRTWFATEWTIYE